MKGDLKISVAWGQRQNHLRMASGVRFGPTAIRIIKSKPMTDNGTEMVKEIGLDAEIGDINERLADHDAELPVEI
jgi:hypothetical protein